LKFVLDVSHEVNRVLARKPKVEFQSRSENVVKRLAPANYFKDGTNARIAMLTQSSRRYLNMLRPCFLVVDRESYGNISTRKLLIETAKFNVITAYSSAESIAALQKFPNVDGVVLDARPTNLSCSALIVQLRNIRPDLPIVVVGNSEHHPCAGASAWTESFDPKELLIVLQQLQPHKAADILAHEQELEKQIA
jgi:CheY-like chemotaxis protein